MAETKDEKIQTITAIDDDGDLNHDGKITILECAGKTRRFMIIFFGVVSWVVGVALMTLLCLIGSPELAIGVFNGLFTATTVVAIAYAFNVQNHTKEKT